MSKGDSLREKVLETIYCKECGEKIPDDYRKLALTTTITNSEGKSQRKILCSKCYDKA